MKIVCTCTHAIMFLFLVGYKTDTFNSGCPEPSERYLRSKAVCDDFHNYTCLFDENLNSFKESCFIKNDFQRPGYRVTLRTNLHADACPYDLYQPFIFFTNKSSNCALKRSFCSEEGQVVSNNGTKKSDTQCRCNYANGYTYVTNPKNICSCTPSTEDCSCCRTKCPLHQILSPDYRCINKADWYHTHLCSPIKHVRLLNMTDTSDAIYIKNDHKDNVKKGDLADNKVIIRSIELLLVLLLLLLVMFLISSLKGDTSTVEKTEVEEQSDVCKSISNHDNIIEKTQQQFDENKTEENQKLIISNINDQIPIFNERVKWTFEIKSFEETMVITAIKKTIMFTSCILLWGKPDCGKTSSLKHIALYLKDLGYKLTPCNEPCDILDKNMETEKRIFVIDDIYGRFIFSYDRYSLWKIKEKSIETVLQDSDAKILISCSSAFKSHMKNVSSAFTKNAFDLTAPRLFDKSAQHHDNDIIQSLIKHNRSDTLPLSLIKLGGCIPEDETLVYIHDPSSYLKKKAEELLPSNISAFCSLLICILKKGRIDEAFLTSDVNQEKFLQISDKVCKKLDIAVIPQKISLSENALNIFIEKDNDAFSIKQSTVFNDLAIFFGKKVPKVFIEHADLEIITQHCILETCDNNAENKTMCIEVKDENENLYFERIKEQFISRDIGEVLCIPQIRFPQYKRKLKEFWKKVGNDDREKFILRYKESVTTFESAGTEGYVDLQKLCFELTLN